MSTRRKLASEQHGQTLIALLIFMMLTIVIGTTAAAVTIINTSANNRWVNGESALAAAETGAENAMMQLERNPSYTGETMNINSTATATISVSGTTTKTITSVGAVSGVGITKRTIVATVSYSSNIFTLTSWVETP